VWCEWGFNAINIALKLNIAMRKFEIIFLENSKKSYNSSSPHIMAGWVAVLVAGEWFGY
jgi:hypothetical protein